MKLSIYVPLATFLAFFAVAERTDDSPSVCLNTCLNEAALVAGCTSQWDHTCTCPSKPFMDTLGTCLTDSCTDEDLTMAKKLHQERCNGGDNSDA
ncbi:hypothetical protein N7513_013005 [Penicillium frequentans]|uniref:CFEM domain-containing protein n=1 Tax=Penicillium frequentans TaxID=3151616 RepID=A0AAD6D2W9_9EURO|nr:hypothetical protein N7513_013005 [Penicillium glabrum]KAJ5552539.1 hypothetical protein N7494_001917 [Penicillium glabrum]